MAKRRPDEQLIFAVEEKHRGKWQPLIGEDDKPRIVKTTKAFAEAQNIDSDTQKIRYVLKKESASDSDLDALKKEYKEKTGNNAHHTWDAEKIKEKLEAL